MLRAKKDDASAGLSTDKMRPSVLDAGEVDSVAAAVAEPPSSRSSRNASEMSQLNHPCAEIVSGRELRDDESSSIAVKFTFLCGCGGGDKLLLLPLFDWWRENDTGNLKGLKTFM